MDIQKGEAHLGERPRWAGEKAMDTDFAIDDAAIEKPRNPSNRDLLALVAAGYSLVELRPRSKAPVRLGWSDAPTDNEAVLRAVEGGANAGVRLGPKDLIVDVDPKNGGESSFAKLLIDLDLDFSRCPRTVTGSGGAHYFLRRPEGMPLLTNLREYPGIDFKSAGQVVAPGSIHPNGKFYESNYYAYEPELAPDAPAALLSLLERKQAKSGQSDRGGELTPRMLAANLVQLDASEWNEYSEWMNMMMACHHATNGEGLGEFTEWSTSAPDYADSAEVIAYKWSGLTAGDGGVTVKYLFRQLLDRGLVVHDKQEPEDDFEVVEIPPAGICAESKKHRRDWRVLTIEDLLNMPPPRWIVEGALQEHSVAVLFGAPGAGKSFAALDIALSMASGISWHGKAVIPGNVLFVAAEGAAGLGVRVQAWLQEHQLSSPPNSFQLFTHEITLADGTMSADFEDFIADRAMVAAPQLIVIDTLSQTSTGFDENSNTDMAKYFKRAQALVNRTGATVLVVHHTGKDPGKGERGAFAIRGNVDTSIQAKKEDVEGRSFVSLYAVKQKNDEQGQITELEMVRREFVVRSGTSTSSLVLVPSSRARATSDKVFLQGRLVLDWIVEWLGDRSSVSFMDLLSERVARTGTVARTSRHHLMKLIGQGFENASVSSNGSRIWLERDAANPKGSFAVHMAVDETS
ncbi:AAA family ATPase [Arenimonas alkanexedens]